MHKSRALKQLILISTCLALIGCSGNTETQLQSFPEIDSKIQAEIDADLIPGAVLLISKNNQIVYRKAYGYAQKYAYGKKLLSKPVPMHKNTLFDLASLTKVFATTYAIMLLHDKGLIELDALVSKYLPGFAVPDKSQITVRHLLTHSSGLTEWQPVYYHATNKHQALNYINELPRKYPVGEARHYSDFGFMTLGYIVEAVSGKPLNMFVEKNLYQPLNLINTSFVPENRAKVTIAATSHGNPFEHRMVVDDNFGYKCDEDEADFTAWRTSTLIGEVNDGNSFYAHQGVTGHAGLFSTADELNILLNVLLNQGKFNGKQIIKTQTVRAFLTKDRFGNGLGWAMSSRILCTENHETLEVFGHTGFTGTYALGVPALNLAIILLTNRQNVGVDETGRYTNLKKLRQSVVDIILQSYAEPK